MTHNHYETETYTKPKDIRWPVLQPATNFIAQGLHLQQKLFEENKSTK
jgi:hypothetical protein